MVHGMKQLKIMEWLRRVRWDGGELVKCLVDGGEVEEVTSVVAPEEADEETEVKVAQAKEFCEIPSSARAQRCGG